ncbi:MAG: hypothetical protein Q9159_007268 [Coniocarpon cinnabarinum]
MSRLCNRSLFSAVRYAAAGTKNTARHHDHYLPASRASNTWINSVPRPRYHATLGPVAAVQDAPHIPLIDPNQYASRINAIRNAPSFSEFLTDTFDRQHNYLRISITEKCNLACTYCMPDGYKPNSAGVEFLTPREIQYLASLFVSQGVTKIRITGGEPFTNGQVLPILENIGALKKHGLQELCITTNATHLSDKKLAKLAQTGLTGINISLDTLEEKQFLDITQRSGFKVVMRAIDRILDMRRTGVPFKLKINAVIMRKINDDQIMPFMDFIKDRDVEVRFIEYMPFNGNPWEQKKMITYAEMLGMMQEKYPNIYRRQDHPSDASKTWQIPGFTGRVGFISSMSKDFCATCNRLRITSDGNIKVCLHGKEEVSLRDVLRNGFNDGLPIKEKAWEQMQETVSAHLEGRRADLLPSNPAEARLLQVIGAAVKQKRAAHDSAEELSKENDRRPMTSTDKHSRQAPMRHPRLRPTLPAAHLLYDALLPSSIATQALRLSTFSKPPRFQILASSRRAPHSRPLHTPGSSKHEDKDMKPRLTHLNPNNNTVRMVTLDSTKPITQRRATAISTLIFSNAQTPSLIRAAHIKKGDVLSVARIAGIQASKKTDELIPLCHNIPLRGTDVDVDLLEPDADRGFPQGALKVSATVSAEWKTGVEMEALTAATVAGLTAYDMCKAVDKGMTLTDVRVVHKEGGRSGTWSDGEQIEEGYGKGERET